MTVEAWETCRQDIYGLTLDKAQAIWYNGSVQKWS